MKVVDAIKNRWVVWVWNHTPTCAEMSRLASQSFEQTPSLKLWLKMRLHFLICVWCERYQKHLRFLRRVAWQVPDTIGAAPERALTAEAKQRMVQRLRAAHHR